MTAITEEQQLSGDLDWFAVDEVGNIGHFASGGFKILPASVVASAVDRAALTCYFERCAAQTGDVQVDVGVSAVVGLGNTPERYLRSFVAMARKGLFSFDIESYLSPGICYFRVASPLVPISIGDVPPEIRVILERTRAVNRVFGESMAVPYEETTSW